MDWRGRLETLTALTVLPVGVVLALLCGLATVVLGFAALLVSFLTIAAFDGPGAYLLVAPWCWFATVAFAYGTVTATEALSGLDWRPLLRVAGVVGFVALTYPAFWFPEAMARLAFGP